MLFSSRRGEKGRLNVKRKLSPGNEWFGPEASLGSRVDSCTDNGTELRLDLPFCKLFLAAQREAHRARALL